MKPWYASKTIWGAVVVLLSVMASHFGLTLTDSDSDSLVNALSAVGETVGSILVIWGRVRATKQIGKPNPNMLGVLACLPLLFLAGCSAQQQFVPQTFADALALSETTLKTCYNTVAIVKRSGYIDAEARDRYVAQVDQARDAIRLLEAQPQNADWTTLNGIQQSLLALQQILLEIQNGHNTQGNTSSPGDAGAGDGARREYVQTFSY